MTLRTSSEQEVDAVKTFYCGDVNSGCETSFSGEDEDEIMAQMPAHAREAHGMDELPPEVRQEIRDNIREG